MIKFLQTMKFKTDRKLNRIKYSYTASANSDIKINIVCFDTEGWILNKFAQEMKKKPRYYGQQHPHDNQR